MNPLSPNISINKRSPCPFHISHLTNPASKFICNISWFQLLKKASRRIIAGTSQFTLYFLPTKSCEELFLSSEFLIIITIILINIREWLGYIDWRKKLWKRGKILFRGEAATFSPTVFLGLVYEFVQSCCEAGGVYIESRRGLSRYMQHRIQLVENNYGKKQYDTHVYIAAWHASSKLILACEFWDFCGRVSAYRQRCSVKTGAYYYLKPRSISFQYNQCRSKKWKHVSWTREKHQKRDLTKAFHCIDKHSIGII